MATSNSKYTATVAAPTGVSYTSGASFNGLAGVSGTSVTVRYTLGSTLPFASTTSTITLTATVSDTKFIDSTSFSADVTLSTAGSDGRLYSATTGTSILLRRSQAPLTATDNTVATMTAISNPSSSASVSASASTSTVATSDSQNSTSTTGSSSTATAGSSSANPGTSSSISTGELAGVAIGVLIAGALVAALITFLLMRRKNKRNLRRYNSGQGHSSLSPAGEAIVVDGKSWQRHLPQSESDHTTGRATTELFDQIELHVENFYTDKMIEMQNTIVDQPSQLLSEAISSGLRPTSAIKYVMTTIVLSSIDFQGNSEYSLLPANFNTVKVQTDYKKPGFTQAISQWRTLTAYLGANTLQTEAYLGDRERKIATITNQLCRAFQPWLHGDNNSCHQSTNGVLRRGSDLGVMLFSQPASFVWDWGQDQPRRGGKRTILPGLLKVTDEIAQPLTKHVCLVKRRTDT